MLMIVSAGRFVSHDNKQSYRLTDYGFPLSRFISIAFTQCCIVYS